MDDKSRGFTFFKSYYEAMKELDSKEAGDLIKAMGSYAFEDKEPNFKSKSLRMAWSLISPILSTSKKRSEARRKGIRKDTEI